MKAMARELKQISKFPVTSEKLVIRVLFMVLLVPTAAAIVGSRWFSKIAFGPLFALDVLLVPALFSGIVLSWIFRREFTLKNWMVFASLLLLPGLALARILSLEDVSRTVLRDGYPFLVLAYGAVAGLALSQGSRLIMNDLKYVLTSSLVIHWLWVSLAMIAAQFYSHLGFGSRIRADLDGMLIGALAAALLLFPASSRFKKIALIAVGMLLVAQLSLLGSRAAFVATVIMMILAAVLRYRSTETWLPRNRAGRLFAPVLVALVGGAIGIGNSAALQEKFVGLFDVAISPPAYVEGPTNQAGANEKQPAHMSEDYGTTLARLNSWNQLIYYSRTEGKLLAGFGPGSDYFHDSGAAALLLGEGPAKEPDASRHPHNILLSSVGLFGIPATLYLTALIIGAGASGLRSGRDTLPLQLAEILLCGYVATSLFGVIFEGPYGAVPISWLIGFLFLGVTGLNGAERERCPRLKAP